MRFSRRPFLVLTSFFAVACSGGGTSAPPQAGGVAVQNATAPAAGPSSVPAPVPPGGSPSAVVPSNAPVPPTPPATPVVTPPPANSAIVAPAGFRVSVVANVSSARQLAFLPDGDLLVATGGNAVALVPNADGPGIAGTAHTFATFNDAPAQGVAYGNGSVYVATQHAVWLIPYQNGAQTGAAPRQIAAVRQGSVAPNSDGDVHVSSSVTVTSSRVFVGVGSSCNACVETDPTRATVQVANLDGSGMTTYAKRFRNALALAVNPATSTVWAGGAGQDALPTNHPYEFFDAVSSHAPVADYGWPACEENQHAYASGANCSQTVIPRVELPAYSTIIGAAFYPVAAAGTYAFPAAYRGGLFLAAHGSWHTPNGHHVPPHVVFVAMNGDTPALPVNWSDPTAQWRDFLSGFQNDANNDARIGRPTGIAVGPQGSLLVADDQTGNVYRVRPTTAGAGATLRRR